MMTSSTCTCTWYAIQAHISDHVQLELLRVTSALQECEFAQLEVWSTTCMHTLNAQGRPSETTMTTTED